MIIPLTGLNDVAAVLAARSPDLNHFDYFFWDMLKAQVYSVKIRHTNHLRQHITDACAGIDGNAASMHCVHYHFAQRIELCVSHEGQHIEHAMSCH